MLKKRAGASLRALMTVALGASAAITATAAPAMAQDEEEQVIVTATRREQALQDVPVAVTPLTAEQIENAGVRDLQDLTAVAPTLQFNVSENESSATARLRGVGTQGSNPGLESAVGIFIDGVYRARNGVALGDLGEVSQIEVLRGPQGTLFGRNTSAGLISVVTAGPDLNEFGAGAELTYGDFSETRIAGHITGPLIGDTLGFRLFAASSTRDGFVDVMDFNGDIGDSNTRDMWTVRGQLLFAPNPNWDLRIIADYTERDEECCAAVIYDPERLNGTDVVFPVSNPGFPAEDAPGPSAPGAAGAISLQGGYGSGLGDIPGNLANLGNGDIGNRLAFANRSYGQQIEDWGISGELNFEIGWATLTSVTSYRDWQFFNATDADYSAADLWYRPEGGDAGFGFEIFTQEVRLAGESGPIDWLLGVYYSDETLTRDENLTNGTQFNNFWRSNSGALFPAFDPIAGDANDAIDTALDNSFLDDHYEQEGNSLALFGHAIAEFSPRTHLSVGVRFTHEEKDLTADFDTNFNGPGFTSGAQLLFDAAPSIDATLAFLGAIPAGSFASLAAGVGPAGICSTDFTGVGNATASSLFGTAQQVYCIGTMNPALDGQVFTQTREEEEFSGVIALHHEVTDNISLYGSISRGYKGGGYNLDRNYDGYVQTGPNTFTISYDTAFDPEFVTAFEIGAKTTWFNGRLLANLALFSNDYENYQLNTFNGVSFQVASIPEVNSTGVEFDLFWRTPLDGLTLQGGFALVEAEYGEDDGWVADSYNPYSRINVLGRLPNNDLTNSPNLTLTGAMTYERPIGSLTGLAYLDFRYASDQITGSDLNPAKTQPEFWLVNARLGIGDPNEHWSLELWARNLLDQDYQQIAFDVPLQSGNPNPRVRNYGAFLGDPRTFGVTLRARY